MSPKMLRTLLILCCSAVIIWASPTSPVFERPAARNIPTTQVYKNDQTSHPHGLKDSLLTPTWLLKNEAGEPRPNQFRIDKRSAQLGSFQSTLPLYVPKKFPEAQTNLPLPSSKLTLPSDTHPIWDKLLLPQNPVLAETLMDSDKITTSTNLQLGPYAPYQQPSWGFRNPWDRINYYSRYGFHSNPNCPPKLVADNFYYNAPDSNFEESNNPGFGYYNRIPYNSNFEPPFFYGTESHQAPGIRISNYQNSALNNKYQYEEATSTQDLSQFRPYGSWPQRNTYQSTESNSNGGSIPIFGNAFNQKTNEKQYFTSHLYQPANTHYVSTQENYGLAANFHGQSLSNSQSIGATSSTLGEKKNSTTENAHQTSYINNKDELSPAVTNTIHHFTQTTQLNGGEEQANSPISEPQDSSVNQNLAAASNSQSPAEVHLLQPEGAVPTSHSATMQSSAENQIIGMGGMEHVKHQFQGQQSLQSTTNKISQQTIESASSHTHQQISSSGIYASASAQDIEALQVIHAQPEKLSMTNQNTSVNLYQANETLSHFASTTVNATTKIHEEKKHSTAENTLQASHQNNMDVAPPTATNDIHHHVQTAQYVGSVEQESAPISKPQGSSVTQHYATSSNFQSSVEIHSPQPVGAISTSHNATNMQGDNQNIGMEEAQSMEHVQHQLQDQQSIQSSTNKVYQQTLETSSSHTHQQMAGSQNYGSISAPITGGPNARPEILEITDQNTSFNQHRMNTTFSHSVASTINTDKIESQEIVPPVTETTLLNVDKPKPGVSSTETGNVGIQQGAMSIENVESHKGSSVIQQSHSTNSGTDSHQLGSTIDEILSTSHSAIYIEQKEGTSENHQVSGDASKHSEINTLVLNIVKPESPVFQSSENKLTVVSVVTNSSKHQDIGSNLQLSGSILHSAAGAISESTVTVSQGSLEKQPEFTSTPEYELGYQSSSAKPDLTAESLIVHQNQDLLLPSTDHHENQLAQQTYSTASNEKQHEAEKFGVLTSSGTTIFNFTSSEANNSILKGSEGSSVQQNAGLVSTNSDASNVQTYNKSNSSKEQTTTHLEKLQTGENAGLAQGALTVELEIKHPTPPNVTTDGVLVEHNKTSIIMSQSEVNVSTNPYLEQVPSQLFGAISNSSETIHISHSIGVDQISQSLAGISASHSATDNLNESIHLLHPNPSSEASTVGEALTAEKITSATTSGNLEVRPQHRPMISEHLQSTVHSTEEQSSSIFQVTSEHIKPAMLSQIVESASVNTSQERISTSSSNISKEHQMTTSSTSTSSQAISGSENLEVHKESLPSIPTGQETNFSIIEKPPSYMSNTEHTIITQQSSIESQLSNNQNISKHQTAVGASSSEQSLASTHTHHSFNSVSEIVQQADKNETLTTTDYQGTTDYQQPNAGFHPAEITNQHGDSLLNENQNEDHDVSPSATSQIMISSSATKQNQISQNSISSNSASSITSGNIEGILPHHGEQITATVTETGAYVSSFSQNASLTLETKKGEKSSNSAAETPSIAQTYLSLSSEPKLPSSSASLSNGNVEYHAEGNSQSVNSLLVEHADSQTGPVIGSDLYEGGNNLQVLNRPTGFQSNIEVTSEIPKPEAVVSSVASQGSPLIPANGISQLNQVVQASATGNLLTNSQIIGGADILIGSTDSISAGQHTGQVHTGSSELETQKGAESHVSSGIPNLFGQMISQISATSTSFQQLSGTAGLAHAQNSQINQQESIHFPISSPTQEKVNIGTSVGTAFHNFMTGQTPNPSASHQINVGLMSSGSHVGITEQNSAHSNTQVSQASFETLEHTIDHHNTQNSEALNSTSVIEHPLSLDTNHIASHSNVQHVETSHEINFSTSSNVFQHETTQTPSTSSLNSNQESSIETISHHFVDGNQAQSLSVSGQIKPGFVISGSKGSSSGSTLNLASSGGTITTSETSSANTVQAHPDSNISGIEILLNEQHNNTTSTTITQSTGNKTTTTQTSAQTYSHSAPIHSPSSSVQNLVIQPETETVSHHFVAGNSVITPSVQIDVEIGSSGQNSGSSGNVYFGSHGLQITQSSYETSGHSTVQVQSISNSNTAEVKVSHEKQPLISTPGSIILPAPEPVMNKHSDLQDKTSFEHSLGSSSGIALGVTHSSVQTSQITHESLASPSIDQPIGILQPTTGKPAQILIIHHGTATSEQINNSAGQGNFHQSIGASDERVFQNFTETKISNSEQSSQNITHQKDQKDSVAMNTPHEANIASKLSIQSASYVSQGVQTTDSTENGTLAASQSKHPSTGAHIAQITTHNENLTFESTYGKPLNETPYPHPTTFDFSHSHVSEIEFDFFKRIPRQNLMMISAEYFIFLLQQNKCDSLKQLIPILQRPMSGIILYNKNGEQ